MNKQPRTLEQVVLGLAMREKPCQCTLGPACPYCQSIRYEPGNAAQVHATTCLGDCLGTGQVPEFPMLRRVCTGDVVLGYVPGFGFMGDRATREHERCGCGGRGWLPACTTDALLEAGKPWAMGVRWDGEDWMVMWLELGNWKAHSVQNADKQMALALALEAENKGL